MIELELPELDLLPVVSAGAVITDGEDRRGRLGFLALTSQRDIVGLTTSSIVENGANAWIVAGAEHIASGPICPIRDSIDPESPIDALVSMVPIVKSVYLRADFAGLEESKVPALPVIDGKATTLYRGASRIALGPVVATHATVYRKVEDRRIVYYGGAQVETDGQTLQRGDAGAAVCNERGEPIGVLVGAEGNLAILAPLAPLLHAAQLTPLSLFEASRHFDLALKSAESEYEDRIVAVEKAVRSVTDISHEQLVLAPSAPAIAKLLEELT
ncbi:MAG TPA: hypothetical protein VF503_19880 [Sphingobium sp.]|uniref:hypothetical protein n=1 Tax=Sphingobium sp. TaxID=1912891 RepID=UPI002ED09954